MTQGFNSNDNSDCEDIQLPTVILKAKGTTTKAYFVRYSYQKVPHKSDCSNSSFKVHYERCFE